MRTTMEMGMEGREKKMAVMEKKEGMSGQVVG